MPAPARPALSVWLGVEPFFAPALSLKLSLWTAGLGGRIGQAGRRTL